MTTATPFGNGNSIEVDEDQDQDFSGYDSAGLAQTVQFARVPLIEKCNRSSTQSLASSLSKYVEENGMNRPT